MTHSVSTISQPSGDDILRGARQLLYQFFSLAMTDPRAVRWRRLRSQGFLEAAAAAAEYVAGEPAAGADPLAPGEHGLEALELAPAVSRLRALSGEDAIAEHDHTFGLVLSKECPPYETEYCPQTFSVYRSQELADIAGFYRAFGLEPSSDVPERADHVALELELMAWLVAKEQHALTGDPALRDERVDVCRDAQVSFLREHLAWWVPAFAHALCERAEPGSLYAVVAPALAAFVAAERALSGVPAPTELLAPRPIEAPPACEGCGASPGDTP